MLTTADYCHTFPSWPFDSVYQVFKKMGLKMLDRIKRVGQKRGLDDDDDIDEVMDYSNVDS